MEEYRILIVEDDTVIAKQMKDHLEKWRYLVEEAQMCCTMRKNHL